MSVSVFWVLAFVILLFAVFGGIFINPLVLLALLLVALFGGLAMSSGGHHHHP